MEKSILIELEKFSLFSEIDLMEQNTPKIMCFLRQSFNSHEAGSRYWFVFFDFELQPILINGLKIDCDFH